jgi:hypothetical protein
MEGEDCMRSRRAITHEISEQVDAVGGAVPNLTSGNG